MAVDHPGLQDLAPGVRGLAFEERGMLYITVIIAKNEGAGDVGRYLDSLPTGKTIRVGDVESERLIGMLERRGYEEIGAVWSDTLDDLVDVWERQYND